MVVRGPRRVVDMMTDWRVNFPCMRNPADGKEYLVVWMKPIAPARPDLDATHCFLAGFNRDTKWCKWIGKIADWHRARMAPVTLTQTTGIPAPSGELVDASGKSVLT